MFIDTHAHLTDKAFAGREEEILQNAKDCLVEKVITSGFDLASSKEAIDFARKHDGVYASIGFYPEFVQDYTVETEEKLKYLAKDKKVVAIGEIGLQYTDGMPERELQKEVFLKQLKLAYQLEKPVVLHCRDAYGDMIKLLKGNKDLLVFGGTFHCFSGSYEIAMEAIKLGFYISIGGVSTFKNATNVKEVLKNVPLERMLLETDCPYLAPHPYRGKINEPKYIPTIAENLAVLKGVDVETVAKITTENARRLFKI